MLLSLLSFLVVGLAAATEASQDAFVKRTNCGGRQLTYDKLAGFGELRADFRDKYGDTVSIGSAIHLDETSWKLKRDGSYTGTLYTLPDRGWNTEGTTAYQPRLHIFDVAFKPDAPNEKTKPYKNLSLHYRDTILFKDPHGNPLAGLDPTTAISYKGFPKLPAAKYTGNGFGGPGKGGTRVCLDGEGLVAETSSSYTGSYLTGFWISDEYGPYIYHFTAEGMMDVAIRPPDAFIPLRNGTESFASDNPPIYDPDQEPVPEDPSSGRTNNQGFEGLSYVAEEDALFAMLQSAAIQDGGEEGDRYARHVRLLRYNLNSRAGKRSWLSLFSRAAPVPKPELVGEWVVPLPRYVDYTENDPEDNPKVAAQSEILALDAQTFLTLARDSDFGYGAEETRSVYRHADVFSLKGASDVLGRFDGFNEAVSPGGKLRKSIEPAELCPWLDFNDEEQLERFGLKNGGKNITAQGLLNEKWEGLSLVPVKSASGNQKGKFYLFASNDNDFITQNGLYNFGRGQYSDESGLDVKTQMLVFEVEIM